MVLDEKRSGFISVKLFTAIFQLPPISALSAGVALWDCSRACNGSRFTAFCLRSRRTPVSGIPSPNAGFGACFSTLLLNLLSCLIVLFLLGVTAFGAVGIPVFLLVRGAAVGLGALRFLLYGGGMGCSALCYLPSAAGSSLLLLLFSSRALAFSNGLALAGFAKRQENLDFSFYFKDFLVFACFSVVVALTGALLAKTYGAFL